MALLKAIKGDITKTKADAIVNAANTSLMGGGGVDGAIHRAGGAEILEDCSAIVAKQGGCKIGEAVITTAGKLSAQFVIHTVGPVWRANKPELAVLLANAYRNSLQLALDNNVKTIAFPNISTGIYKYPKEEACTIALATTKLFLENNPNSLDEIIFVCFDEDNFNLYQQAISE